MIDLKNADQLSELLFQKMQVINPAIQDMELFEFRYALENMLPKSGWDSIRLEETTEIENLVNSPQFYNSIQLRPKENGKPVMDIQVIRLTQQLFLGLVTGKYSHDWILRHFYFDLRGFYFLHRSQYYTSEIIRWLGGKPFKTFEQKQKSLTHLQAVGYQDFKRANSEVDQFFVDLTKVLVKVKSKPILIGIAGQTAAGKTEIVSHLQAEIRESGYSITSLEIDHFLTDRDYREEKGIDSLGKDALHFELFIQSLKELRRGNSIKIPQYDFIQATSSHNLDGKIKPGRYSGEVMPADLIFIEGNFPFLYTEVAELIDLKVIYLTDDEIRMKRKWRRDIDYRKKYDLYYFLNRYFREQFLMAEAAYKPQMGMCDMLIDTTQAEVWLTPEVQLKLDLLVERRQFLNI
jgi:uridine kinase